MNIKKWTRPQYYYGESWNEYYSFLGQSRDSNSLEQSNFACGLEAIGGESDTVIIVRESHWAVGWVEWIAIHESNTDAIMKADEILAKLEDYPVINEDDLSERELNEACETWENMSIKERVELLQKFSNIKYYRTSVFAARRSELPELPYWDDLIQH